MFGTRCVITCMLMADAFLSVSPTSLSVALASSVAISAATQTQSLDIPKRTPRSHSNSRRTRMSKGKTMSASSPFDFPYIPSNQPLTNLRPLCGPPLLLAPPLSINVDGFQCCRVVVKIQVVWSSSSSVFKPQSSFLDLQVSFTAF